VSDNNTGWIADPQAVNLVSAAQPFERWGDTPAGGVDVLPLEVFLWKAWEKIRGVPFPSRNQGQVGSCVSFGTACAIEITTACEIAQGELEESRDLVQEIIYAGSRVEIGKGRFSSDGSIGAWAADYVKSYGVLSRGIYKTYDLTKYSETRCRAWGAPKAGVPDDLEPEIRQFPVRGITLVKTWAEAKSALAQGHGIAVCSNQGFRLSRDKLGFATASGNWGHCMAIIGYQTVGREGGFIMNSWGPDSMTGPVGAGNPPVGGFWADSAVIGKMLAAGDSWAFSSVDGFPSKKTDWWF
jgi:hypothetical protein